MVNAPATLPSPSTIDPFQAATEAFNTWRGRCLASFAAVEAGAAETLVALAQVQEGVALPHLFGQRLAALELALSRSPEGSEATACLAQFRPFEPLRSFLAHGVAHITLDRHGSWHATLTVTALKQRAVQRSYLLIDAAEAEETARALSRERQRLLSRLAALRPEAPPGLPRILGGL